MATPLNLDTVCRHMICQLNTPDDKYHVTIGFFEKITVREIYEVRDIFCDHFTDPKTNLTYEYDMNDPNGYTLLNRTKKEIKKNGVGTGQYTTGDSYIIGSKLAQDILDARKKLQHLGNKLSNRMPTPHCEIKDRSVLYPGKFNKLVFSVPGYT